MDYHERIVKDPSIRRGKPTIKGTRIAVTDILEYLAGGDSKEDILKNFPTLTLADVEACTAYDADGD